MKKNIERFHLQLHGSIQGVGFRPFVYRLATSLQLTGSITNTVQGVLIEIEGERHKLNSFMLKLETEKPPHSFIYSLEKTILDPKGETQFEIRASQSSGEKEALILPDLAPCLDCLKEIADPKNRRYLYPFTNCTHCGPRFSIIQKLPYDRAHTSMHSFQMCAQCQKEYDDPLNRRFHAQPNACPQCGPHLELWTDQKIASRHPALLQAIQAIKQGRIVAVKGVGGFQLMVDAQNEKAVAELRKRKNREEKPFALMFPSLKAIKEVCRVSTLEEELLLSSAAPIVFLERSSKLPFNAIAPNNPYLGIMLPSSPLHVIFMQELNRPVVATSGNLSDEPICIENQEAFARLHSIADLFLVHNRPILRPVDDSIARMVLGRELILRRARGYAPLPFIFPASEAPNLLAVGAHLKNTIALFKKDKAFVSQHIGDLETPQAYDAFQKTISDFLNIYEGQPAQIVSDLHPDYLSTQFAQQKEPLQIQHHVAHVLSCMAENQITPPLLGVAWDGTGYGTDHTLWGGEFLKITPSGFERVATLIPFPLPGGAKAIQEPRRTALGLLYELLGDSLFKQKKGLASFTEKELALLKIMLQKKIQTPKTSSIGRLFDAVAALSGLRQISKFEGQAAMDVEFAAFQTETDKAYPFELIEKSPSFMINWKPMIQEMLEESKTTPAFLSAKFHNTLASMILHVAQKVGLQKVVLSGGCFQNKKLTELAVRQLQKNGFSPYWHQRIPPNDGGIALGQIYGALRHLSQETKICV